MLCLTKKTEYALIALASLGQRPTVVVSAREIASEHALPVALLMNIMKALQQRDVVTSVRGAKGGYVLGPAMADLSLHDLILALEGRVQTTGCEEHGDVDALLPAPALRAIEAPVRALQYRLTRFLNDVKVADLVLLGRRIDVPAELVGCAKARRSSNASRALNFVKSSKPQEEPALVS